MREVCLAQLDKTRPVVVLTREPARAAMTKITVAPITSTVKGLISEVPVGPENGLDHASAVALDNTMTIRVSQLGRTIGSLTEEQEAQLALAVMFAYDLDMPRRGPHGAQVRFADAAARALSSRYVFDRIRLSDARFERGCGASTFGTPTLGDPAWPISHGRHGVAAPAPEHAPSKVEL